MTNRNSLKKYPDMLLVDHLCEVLHCGKSTVYTLLKDGKIKSLKVGGKYIVSKQWLLDFLQSESTL